MEQVTGAIEVINFAKPLWQMNARRNALRGVVEDLKTLKSDIDSEARAEESTYRYRRRKEMVVAYFPKVDDFIIETTGVLDKIEQEGVLRPFRLAWWVTWIERQNNGGEELVREGRELQRSGLTHNVVRKRGDKLPVRELNKLGVTAGSNLQSALTALSRPQNCRMIGIYGCLAAGKKTLMKHIYNTVLDDPLNFEAVYWAEAPEIPGNDYAIQERVSEGMGLDIKHDSDSVRRASLLEERFKEIFSQAEAGLRRSSRVILFLGNLRQDFRTYEVLGLSAPNCVLVFTAPSLDVCNRMKCDKIIKVDHLSEEEAMELFMAEAWLRDDDDDETYGNELEIKRVAGLVARECARMPLAIRLIAKSMRKIKDLREWRNRLTELLGTISSINNEEEKILEQLKFAYVFLEDTATLSFFEVAARVLGNDAQLSKEEIIQAWRDSNLIGNGTDADDNDQGHTMLNQLERLCLLQVESSFGKPSLVSMNKWIRKIASPH